MNKKMRSQLAREIEIQLKGRLTIISDNGRNIKNKSGIVLISFKLNPLLIIRFSDECLEYRIQNNLKFLTVREKVAGIFSLSLIRPNVDITVKSFDFDQTIVFCEKLELFANSMIFKPQIREKIKKDLILDKKNYKKIVPESIEKLKVYLSSFQILNLFSHRSMPNLTHLFIKCSNTNNYDLLKHIPFLSNLVSLNLSQNKISYLPYFLFNTKIYPKLKYLDLSDNSITLIPNSLFIYLSHTLITLNLSGNKISQLPFNIGILNKLEMLMLDKNELMFLPKSVDKCNNLKKLSLPVFTKKFDGNKKMFIFPTLLNLSIKAILDSRILIQDSIPKSIVEYIEYQCEICLCNLPIPKGYNIYTNQLNIKQKFNLDFFSTNDGENILVSELQCPLCNYKD